MVFTVIRVMMITQNVEFSVKTARALEKLGDFEVVHFTSAQNAAEYLRENPQHLALVDFSLTTASAPAVIRTLRSIKPDIAVIGAPDHAAVWRIAQEIDLQGVVDIPASLRGLVPLLREAVQSRYDSSGTMRTADADTVSPAKAGADEQLSYSRPIEFVMTGDGQTLMQVDAADESYSSETAAQVPGDSLHVFNRLAQEEPPMPSLEESGTVHDLMDRVSRGGSQLTDHVASPEKTETDNEGDGEPGTIMATILLQSALDDSQPLRFSVDAFVDEVNRRLPDDQPRIRPLPSWASHETAAASLPDHAPIPDDVSLTVKVSGSDDEAELYAVQDVLAPADEPDLRTQLPPTLPEFDTLAPAQPTSMQSLMNEEELRAFRQEEAQFLSAMRAEAALAASQPKPPDDPRITQMALVLTQMALETAAEATLLTIRNQIVASAGSLVKEDLDAIDQVIDQDWDAEAELSRIRFVTLPSNGADYLIFSRRTQEDFTLSMIFSGTMPLRVIRRQSDRLEQALRLSDDAQPEPEPPEAVPFESEVSVASASVDDADSVVRVPQTLMWLLRDTDSPLLEVTTLSLEVALRREFEAWQIVVASLDVQPDFIYIYALVPESVSPRLLLADLMQVSADHVGSCEPERIVADLWSDSYYVLTPGRDLSPEEIMQFIDFVRVS